MYARADFSAMSNYILDHQTTIASNIDETWSNLKHLVENFLSKFKIPHPKWFNFCCPSSNELLRKKYRLKSTVTNQSKLLMAETELQKSNNYMLQIASEFGQNPRKLYSHLRGRTFSLSMMLQFMIASKLQMLLINSFTQPFQVQVNLICRVCLTYQPLVHS